MSFSDINKGWSMGFATGSGTYHQGNPHDYTWTKDGEYVMEDLMNMALNVNYKYNDGEELVELYDKECDDIDFESVLLERMELAEEADAE